MNRSILYCGDTELKGAAAYLAGLMTSEGWQFEYVPSDVAMSKVRLEQPRSLLILSDYSASQFNLECQQMALQQINNGCGLLMIGGWESFHGYGGDWNGTLLESALPVEIESSDDRMNFDQSAWLLPAGDHAITKGLPWRDCPPAIGGMNRVTAKPNSTVILEAHSYSVLLQPNRTARSELVFTYRESFPALVIGECGAGRTAAFLSDVAPHWVGGFVDWGLPRVNAQASGGFEIEVGGDYARFWKQLLTWTGPTILTDTLASHSN